MTRARARILVDHSECERIMREPDTSILIGRAFRRAFPDAVDVELHVMAIDATDDDFPARL